MRAKTDLVLEREIAVPADLVWRAWTEPEHLKPWFCPRPWQVTDCVIELRPGGRFFFAMRGPKGETSSFDNCVLEVVPGKRLVWTTALSAGFRPKPPSEGVPDFTAVVEIESLEPRKTRYRATAMHRTMEDAATHDRVGFSEGWGAALDQLVALLSR
ncbi:MAG: SRPBCC family protein [Myxococcaceae bacterium]